MINQSGQLPQWPPQQPEQPQTWNSPTQGWPPPQPQNMPSMNQFKRPPTQSLFYGQPQQPQYDPAPVPNYVPPHQQASYQNQQFHPAKTKPVQRRFFSKKVEVPLWMIILSVGVIFILSALILSNGSILGTGNAPSNRSSSNAAISTSSIPTTVPTDTPIPTPSDTPIPTPTDIPSPTPLPTGPLKVGGTLTANGVSCTLISVKFLPDDGFIVPKAGDEFIVVRVKLTNHSMTDFDYYYLDFKARSGSGNVTDSQSDAPNTYTANDQLNGIGTLSPGGSTEGDVILEVPIGDHNAELVWQPTIFDSSTAYTWNLGL